MVNAINRYLMTSVTCNLSALVVCIGIYIVMDSIDETWDMAIMWRWTRAPVILVCMLVIWGSGDTVSAFKYRHFALIPNQFVEEKGSCSHTEWDPDFGTTKFPDARLFRDSWGNFENFHMSMCFFAIFFSSICVSYGTFAATRDRKTMPVSYRLVEPVTSSEGVVAQLATADPFDYTEAIDEAAASSGDPNATQVFALAAVTDVTAPITYFAPTPMPTPRPRGGVPEVTGSSSSSKRKGLRKSTLVSLCVATFFICLTLVLIRLAKSDRLMEELREARKAETRVAVVDSGPEKVHPVAVPVSSDGSDAKDAGFARPAELSLGWRS